MDVAVLQSTLDHLATRLREQSVTLAEEWLNRVQEIVTVSRFEVFPSRRLLDHLPDVLAEIAGCIRSSSDYGIETNHELLGRAAELGELRHIQHASLHQLLREYTLLAELLEEAVAREVAAMERPDPRAVLHAIRRINEAVRVLQQQTVDTFVTNYTQTLERQTTQLRKFSRLVSHEIRQPLAVLQVIARALPVESDAESARMMDIFDRSVVRLTEVTGKLERLARITRATDLYPSERAVDLTEVAHGAAAQLTDAAEAQGVEVRVQPDLPTVRLDPARAELIFVNLIANAIKFADLAKPARYVEVRRSGGDAPSVIVQDNGLGIAPPRLQTIFREFVRAHSQREDDVHASGLGLGLSIVRECMDHANGSVRVDSIQGRGTTFKLTWPAASSPAR